MSMFDNRRYVRHLCECGLCDEWAKVGRRYTNGHSMKGKRQTDVWIAKRVAANRGKKRTLEQTERMGKAQKARFKRDGYTKGAFVLGCVLSKETIKKQIESRKKNAKERGYYHSAKTVAKISDALIGHPGANKGGHISEEQKESLRKAAVRRIQRGGKGNERGRGGWFYSRKNQRKLHYRSHLERDWYMLLEKQTNVESYVVEPVAIPYIWEGFVHLYIPDLLICYTGGFSDLIELKPEFLWNDSKNQAKWLAAKIWCEKRRKRRHIRRFNIYGYNRLQRKSS